MDLIRFQTGVNCAVRDGGLSFIFSFIVLAHMYIIN